MKMEPNNQAEYWDGNLDPANLGARLTDTGHALRQEIEFAQATPDIQQMLEWVCPSANTTDSISFAQSMSSIKSTLSIESIPPASPPPVILDVGTGLGTVAVMLRDRGATVIALDISHSRLDTMRAVAQALPAHSPDAHRAASTGKIFPIKARAEALPFRDGALDGACSRAVLIHTDIPRACDEIARALKPGAPIAFSEVMAHNPLVKLYRRTLAPREWQSITTYFSDAEINTVTSRFDQNNRHPQGGSGVPPLIQNNNITPPQQKPNTTIAHQTRFYQLSFLAFLFQYAIPARTAFRIALFLLTTIDKIIARIYPRYRRFAWFVLITGKNRQS